MENDHWRLGQAPWGYLSEAKDHQGDEHSHLTHHRRTAYFVTQFSFPPYEPRCYGNVFVKLLVDDGAIVYLNGQVLFWSNMVVRKHQFFFLYFIFVNIEFRMPKQEPDGSANYETHAIRPATHKSSYK